MTEVNQTQAEKLQITEVETSHDNILLFRVEGEFDGGTSVGAQDEISIFFETDKELLALDMSEVTYIDSSGLGCLVAVLKRCFNNKRKLFLVGPTEKVQKVLSMAGLNKVLISFPTLEDVLFHLSTTTSF